MSKNILLATSALALGASLGAFASNTLLNILFNNTRRSNWEYVKNVWVNKDHIICIRKHTNEEGEEVVRYDLAGNLFVHRPIDGEADVDVHVNLIGQAIANSYKND